MARRPSNTPLIAGAGIVLALGVGLNFAQYQARPKTQYELRDEAEAEARKAEKTPEAAPPPPAAASPSNKLVELGPDSRIGPPTAEKTVVVAYHWTPEVQAEPMRVWGPVEMLEKMAKSNNAAIRLVNLDHPDAPKLPAGISMKGSVMVPLRPEGGFEPKLIQEAVPRMMMYSN